MKLSHETEMRNYEIKSYKMKRQNDEKMYNY